MTPRMGYPVNDFLLERLLAEKAEDEREEKKKRINEAAGTRSIQFFEQLRKTKGN